MIDNYNEIKTMCDNLLNDDLIDGYEIIKNQNSVVFETIAKGYMGKVEMKGSIKLD